MGRLNLAALRVRRRAIADFETGRTRMKPIWLDVVADIPPAQIFTRQQPIQHPLTKIRKKTISPPSNSDSQLPARTSTEVTTIKPTRSKKRASQVFQPVPIRYEEDELRKQFYSDHPWELARPRVVLETSGDNYTHRDYSRNVRSPNAQLNGESVVQRQLYLLHNVPDIKESQAYDMARKEFYAHRLREEIERRVAAEEAEAVGADFGPSINQRSIELENKTYDEWARWSRQTVLENMQKSAAFTGQMLEGGGGAGGLGDAVDQGSDGQVGGKRFAVQ
ncbi:37S ribosomal protein S25 [Endocarpon pusillum Z07020]|uniref:37S ribosomal protein S25, mitochondrial n=1 Tax=Endocarpon pusillum (strain Z07020 / HMAS-L-300199) TaxID=1263415 RepID=U1GAU1_ENDPU|nr:37S ribosomal protein S25 [Endocarpon pusillum Z07020]ERF74632.1 37S ribosomal protein S25 [Endocarpon pusillum Z07020]